MFPSRISLEPSVLTGDPFREVWKDLMLQHCHRHPLWSDAFASTLRNETVDASLVFSLAATWSVSMVQGSYCFPRYVAALAARAEEDAVRYGLLENAWDEAGSYGHVSRSHFWLAVKLARLLGLSDAEIETIKVLPEALAYTDAHYQECATGDFLAALGMICLIEEFTTPEFTMIFEAFLRSCRKGMGMEPGIFVLRGGAEYFTANIADDERHREEMPRLVATCLKTKGVDLEDREQLIAGLQPVCAGIRRSADLRAQFFEAIYRFVKVGQSFRNLVR